MAKNQPAFETYEPSSCAEVYAEVNKRQVSALMFHDKMADLFDFLGLCGFKMMHEYQYISESKEHRATKRYYMEHHNALIVKEDLYRPEVIPEDWIKYTRMDVTPIVRDQAVQKAMEQYHQWESDTKTLYERCAYYLFSRHMIADFNKINCLICDVDEELEHLTRIMLELSSVDFSMDYIQGMQWCLYDKYKKKLEELKVI